jgi:hypothetical protein
VVSSHAAESPNPRLAISDFQTAVDFGAALRLPRRIDGLYNAAIEGFLGFGNFVREVSPMRSIVLRSLGVFTIVACTAAAPASELDDLLATIRGVGSEAKGSPAAAKAWKRLVERRAADLPAIFAALDQANPLAANYLRSAIETISQRETSRGGKLPAKELEAFLKDTRHDPRGRRLAYEMLAGIDPKAPDRLIPGMLNDPSVELRRDAVARLIAAGAAQLEANRKDEAKATFVSAMAGARDDDQVQSIKKKLMELGETVDLPRHFGFLLRWRLIAPFDNTENKGFHQAYPPEEKLDFNATYEGKDGAKIAWTEHETKDEYGIVDLAKALAPHKGAVTYAAAEFHSDNEQPVDLRLGTPNSWKVWLNGKLLFARDEYHRGMSLDQYRMRGTLRSGKNTILIKVCQNEQKEEWAQRWRFQLRVCDATGTAVLSADRKTAAFGAGSGN